jgi:CRP-like cAMP-binding protein
MTYLVKAVTQPFRRQEIANRLLLSLPKSSLDPLLSVMELRPMVKGDTIIRVGQPIEYCYFINRGLISLVKLMQDGRSVEIGLVGIEGVTHTLSLFVLNKAAIEAMVQLSGSAFRVKRDVLRSLMAEDRFLCNTLEKYAHFAYSAIVQTAACNRLHSIEERCCRWLLLAHDNAQVDTFQITHEFLAMMLGVQRGGVSIAAKLLQKAGLIKYRHGQITIIDRHGLEEAACECYAAMHQEYAQVIGAQLHASRA